MKIRGKCLWDCTEITKLNWLVFHFLQNSQIRWRQEISKTRTKFFLSYFISIVEEAKAQFISLTQALMTKAVSIWNQLIESQTDLYTKPYGVSPLLVSLALQNHSKNHIGRSALCISLLFLLWSDQLFLNLVFVYIACSIRFLAILPNFSIYFCYTVKQYYIILLTSLHRILYKMITQDYS